MKPKYLLSKVLIILLGIASGVILGFSYTSANNNINFTATKDIENIIVPPEVKSNDIESKNPTDYDGLTNFKIAQYYLLTCKSFTSETNGLVNASGISQTIKSTKKYDGKNYFSESISYSIFKQLANRTFYSGDDITILQGTDITKNSATWNGKKEMISQDEYRKIYGGLPTAFIRYIVDSNTVLSQSKVEQTGDLYKFSFDLDPTLSTSSYVHEITTSSGSIEEPIFTSEKISVVIDRNWILKEITVNESYSIKLPLPIGSQNTTSTITETFSNINGDVSLSSDEFIN